MKFVEYIRDYDTYTSALTLHKPLLIFKAELEFPRELAKNAVCTLEIKHNDVSTTHRFTLNNYETSPDIYLDVGDALQFRVSFTSGVFSPFPCVILYGYYYDFMSVGPNNNIDRFCHLVNRWNHEMGLSFKNEIAFVRGNASRSNKKLCDFIEKSTNIMKEHIMLKNIFQTRLNPVGDVDLNPNCNVTPVESRFFSLAREWCDVRHQASDEVGEKMNEDFCDRIGKCSAKLEDYLLQLWEMTNGRVLNASCLAKTASLPIEHILDLDNDGMTQLPVYEILAEPCGHSQDNTIVSPTPSAVKGGAVRRREKLISNNGKVAAARHERRKVAAASHIPMPDYNRELARPTAMMHINKSDIIPTRVI